MGRSAAGQVPGLPHYAGGIAEGRPAWDLQQRGHVQQRPMIEARKVEGESCRQVWAEGLRMK